MKNNFFLYSKYHSSREDERLGLFSALNEKYKIKKVLYPGSFVHITPSLAFPHVVYVDSYNKAATFHQNPEVLIYIKKHKIYSQNSTVIFHKADYTKNFEEKEKSFDLLLSQYAGFISRSCRKYLKIGGLLVTNNSHGDASMAFLDKGFKFIGIYNRRSDKKYSLSDKNLDSYFVPKKKGLKVTRKYLEETQQGVGYTKSPSGYIFRRIQ